MIENTAKVGGISVDEARNKKRLSNRRIAVAISLIVSMFCAIVIGYNMYQTNEVDNTETVMIKKAAVDSILNYSGSSDYEFKEFNVGEVIYEKLSSKDMANGIEKKGYVEVGYSSTIKNGDGKWKNKKSIVTFSIEKGKIKNIDWASIF